MHKEMKKYNDDFVFSSPSFMTMKKSLHGENILSEHWKSA